SRAQDAWTSRGRALAEGCASIEELASFPRSLRALCEVCAFLRDRRRCQAARRPRRDGERHEHRNAADRSPSHQQSLVLPSQNVHGFPDTLNPLLHCTSVYSFWPVSTTQSGPSGNPPQMRSPPPSLGPSSFPPSRTTTVTGPVRSSHDMSGAHDATAHVKRTVASRTGSDHIAVSPSPVAQVLVSSDSRTTSTSLK